MSNANILSQITAVRFTNSSLIVSLSDDREISTPLSWYPKLLKASQEEKDQIEISPFGLHWPSVDEDLSLEGMLAGRSSVASTLSSVDRKAASLHAGELLHQKWSFVYGNVVTDDDKISSEVLDLLHNEIATTRIDR